MLICPVSRQCQSTFKDTQAVVQHILAEHNCSPPDPLGNPPFIPRWEDCPARGLGYATCALGQEYGPTVPTIAAIAIFIWQEQLPFNFYWAGGQEERCIAFHPVEGYTSIGLFPPPLSQEPYAGDVYLSRGALAMGQLYTLMTCLHEVGHALGLGHTAEEGNVMHFREETRPFAALGPGDIRNIVALYGGRPRALRPYF